MRYETIGNIRHSTRSTIAEAVELLSKIHGFNARSTALIYVERDCGVPRSAPGRVKVEYYGLQPEAICGFMLATSSKFTGLYVDFATSEKFSADINKLNLATVDGEGIVTLDCGTRLRAVKLVSARTWYELTDLRAKILKYLIELMGLEEFCYRSQWEGVPYYARRGEPDAKYLDRTRLRGLPVPPLKVIAGYIADREPGLRNLSLQTISDTLLQLGMRFPRPRTKR